MSPDNSQEISSVWPQWRVLLQRTLGAPFTSGLLKQPIMVLSAGAGLRLTRRDTCPGDGGGTEPAPSTPLSPVSQGQHPEARTITRVTIVSSKAPTVRSGHPSTSDTPCSLGKEGAGESGAFPALEHLRIQKCSHFLGCGKETFSVPKLEANLTRHCSERTPQVTLQGASGTTAPCCLRPGGLSLLLATLWGEQGLPHRGH